MDILSVRACLPAGTIQAQIVLLQRQNYSINVGGRRPGHCFAAETTSTGPHFGLSLATECKIGVAISVAESSPEKGGVEASTTCRMVITSKKLAETWCPETNKITHVDHPRLHHMGIPA
jgi:hypothetical protein